MTRVGGPAEAPGDRAGSLHGCSPSKIAFGRNAPTTQLGTSTSSWIQKVARDARQRVGLLAFDAVTIAEVADHCADGIACGLEQVRAHTGADVLTAGFETRIRGDVVLRRVDREVASERQSQHHVHRAFDRGSANLAVALGGVRVAE